MTLHTCLEPSRSERVFNAEAHVKTLTNKLGVNPGEAPPLRDRKPLAIVFDEPRSTRVVRLLLSCRPSAIPGLIVPVVVDPVKLKSVRRPHVREEGGKVVLPSLTHGDSTATVGEPEGLFRIEAPGFSATPNSVLSGVIHPVSRGVGRSLFALPTPATVDHAAVEISREDVFDVPAVAPARPSPRAARNVDVSGHFETSEALPMEIVRDRSCHGSTITGVAA